MAKREDDLPKEIKVKTNSVSGSTYSQLVVVVVTDIDVTLEFVFVNQRPPAESGEVVSRVTVPLKVGEELAKTLSKTIEDHKKKKGDENG